MGFGCFPQNPANEDNYVSVALLEPFNQHLFQVDFRTVDWSVARECQDTDESAQLLEELPDDISLGGRPLHDFVELFLWNQHASLHNVDTKLDRLGDHIVVSEFLKKFDVNVELGHCQQSLDQEVVQEPI